LEDPNRREREREREEGGKEIRLSVILWSYMEKEYWKSEIDFQRFEGFTSREITMAVRKAFFFLKKKKNYRIDF
jgi:hypothetical protein